MAHLINEVTLMEKDIVEIHRGMAYLCSHLRQLENPPDDLDIVTFYSHLESLDTHLYCMMSHIYATKSRLMDMGCN